MIKKEYYIITNHGYVWSKIIRRSILKNNDIRFREKVAYEDLEFIPIVILFCKKICTTNKVLYNYTYNSESITNYYTNEVHVNQKLDSMRAFVLKFKELGVYNDYSNNKYIANMNKKDRLFAEINNNDYRAIINNCSDLLNNINEV